MRHIILTCQNHPNLFWSCKEIAVNDDGRYNHTRNIFFLGFFEGNDSPLRFTQFKGDTKEIARECDCKASELIKAPAQFQYPER